MQKICDTLEERGGYPKCHQISHGVGWGGGGWQKYHVTIFIGNFTGKVNKS
jgi:hypothetical protein